jgi:hypothetical protein
MSPRKEYDQVAQDIMDKNQDANPKLISNAVLRREYEFQATAHAARQPDDVKADAREISSFFSQIKHDDDEQQAQKQ